MEYIQADIWVRYQRMQQSEVHFVCADDTHGKVFLKDAQRLLMQAQAATERARRAAQGEEGALSLSFVPSAALDLLPDIFKRFQHDYPTVQLHVTADDHQRHGADDDQRHGADDQCHHD